MPCTREELFSYLLALFQVTPQKLQSAHEVTVLVHRHRCKEPVQHQLLAAMAPLLGKAAARYQTPGELVSDFWAAVDQYDTPKNILCALYTKDRNQKEKAARRETRDETYQTEEIGTEVSPQEGLPPWFFDLPLEKQEALWRIAIEEETSEERAEDNQTNPATERSKKHRLLKELREIFATEDQGERSPKK